MKVVKWKQVGNSFEAKVGNVNLNVYRSYDGRWESYATIYQIASTMRFGLKRKSFRVAQDEAVRLAKELLIDHHTAIVANMKKFDLFGNEGAG